MTEIKDRILGILAHPAEAEAFAKGKDVQFQNSEGNWFNIGSQDDFFHVDSIYRIKPGVHTETRWVNIYQDGPGAYNFKTKQGAKESARRCNHPQNSVQISRVVITWTEGEGLED